MVPVQELVIQGDHLSAFPADTDHQLATIRGGLDRLPQLVKLTLPSWGLLGALGGVKQRRDAYAYDSCGCSWGEAAAGSSDMGGSSGCCNGAGGVMSSGGCRGWRLAVANTSQ